MEVARGVSRACARSQPSLGATRCPAQGGQLGRQPQRRSCSTWCVASKPKSLVTDRAVAQQTQTRSSTRSSTLRHWRRTGTGETTRLGSGSRRTPLGETARREAIRSGSGRRRMVVTCWRHVMSVSRLPSRSAQCLAGSRDLEEPASTRRAAAGREGGGLGGRGDEEEERHRGVRRSMVSARKGRPQRGSSRSSDENATQPTRGWQQGYGVASRGSIGPARSR